MRFLRLPGPARYALAATLVLGFGAGCDVTPEEIARWKGTERGPGKLRDALRSRSLGADLRAQALVALVELGMTSDAQADLQTADPEAQQAVMHAAVPRLRALIEGTQQAARPADAPTTRVQREAKDALFLLRPLAAPADQGVIDDVLVAWLCTDLAGRMSAGGQGGDKIFEAAGSRGAPCLVTLLVAEQTSPSSRMEAARQLGKVGDAQSRTRAGVALVERARHERSPSEATLQQVGLVGGDHAVAYLTGLAEDARQGKTPRQKALLSLAQRRDAAALPSALRLASDRHAPGEVRDAAFTLAEKIGPAAVPGLLKLLDDSEATVRWRAVEAALSAGGAAAVPEVLEGLPVARGISRPDLVSYVVHDLRAIGPSALPALRQVLGSKSWVARITAVESIAVLGGPADARAVGALAGDPQKLKGWSDGPTIGAVAGVVAGRLAQGSPP